jgi:carbohydrate-binding DOMON domain-containing protein
MILTKNKGFVPANFRQNRPAYRWQEILGFSAVVMKLYGNGQQVSTIGTRQGGEGAVNLSLRDLKPLISGRE